MTDTTKHMLRAMAWERAKGELRSMLVTYEGEKATFDAMDEALAEFVDTVEENGWAE